MKRYNKNALYEKIMQSVSKEVKKALNEDVTEPLFKPFIVKLLLNLDDEEVKDNLFADLDTFQIKIGRNPYGSNYSEKMVSFTITNVEQLKEWADYFKVEFGVDHILAKDDSDDDALEFMIENDNGRKKFRNLYMEYVEYAGNTNYKLALKCANKLLHSIYGGDYNELKYCMDRKDYDNAREVLRAINRSYSKRVFTSEEMKFILNNWKDVMNVFDKLD